MFRVLQQLDNIERKVGIHRDPSYRSAKPPHSSLLGGIVMRLHGIEQHLRGRVQYRSSSDTQELWTIRDGIKALDTPVFRKLAKGAGVDIDDRLQVETMVQLLLKKGITFVSFLGVGTYGIVCKIRDNKGITRALKLITTPDATTNAVSNYINIHINECKKLKRFVLESWIMKVGRYTCIVSEALSGDLESFLSDFHENVEKSELHKFVQKSLICQIIYGLFCLHRIGIIHADLKESNLFYKGTDDTIELRFADFDGSGILEWEKKPTVSTARIMIYSKDEVGSLEQADDIFAAGLIFIHIFDEVVWENINRINSSYRKDDRTNATKSSDFRSTVYNIIHNTNTIPEEFKPLLIGKDGEMGMLDPDSQKRPSAEQIYDDAIIKTYCEDVGALFSYSGEGDDFLEK